MAMKNIVWEEADVPVKPDVVALKCLHKLTMCFNTLSWQQLIFISTPTFFTS